MSKIGTDVQESREIRVFLSSTFRDMDEERTYLVKQIFPKVRAACLERQVGFSEIDLRWGVSEEEAKNGATVEICLKEINRCRDFPPFFIGFLGERYGWVPRHDELSSYWKLHNDSEFALPIKKAIERGISVTELEMELAVLQEGAAEKIAEHALFCLRDKKLTDTLYTKSKADNSKTRNLDFYDAGEGKLEALKSKIRKSGFLGLDNYTTIEQFGAAIEKYLLNQLDIHFPVDAIPSKLERSNAAHAGFRFHRLQNFLQRTDVRDQMIQAINQRIEKPSLGPILLTGPSGQGKSALMADLARHYQTQFTKDWRVIDHYIGADNANHLDGWVDRILETLHPDIQDIAGDIPASQKDKFKAISTWISMAARRNKCRYLFILDALDQLSDEGKNLSILSPQTLGPDCILIASAANNTIAQVSATQWQTLIKVLPLTNELRAQLITETLLRYRKYLPEDLARKLASASQSGSPLFLVLALEELRIDARHETLAQATTDILKQKDAEQLFLNHFLLDADNGRTELPELAACFMALLGAAQGGLSEVELADLLALPSDPIAPDTGKPRMPQIHLSRLLANLAPFLINKQGRHAPMHRILGKVAVEYYGIAPVREHLYAYFSPRYGKDDINFDARGAAEALYQITELTKLAHVKQHQSKKQLIKDIGYLPLPVKLHEYELKDGEDIVLKSIRLATSNENDQSLLKTLWLPQLSQYEDLSSLSKFGENVGFINIELALFIVESVLKTREKTFGPEHLATAESLSGLASLRNAEGHLVDAELCYRRSLTIREKILGYDHPSIGNNLRDLADLLRRKSNILLRKGSDIETVSLLRETKSLYIRSLSIAESALNPNTQNIFHLLNKLAYTLEKHGDTEAAEPLYRRAMEIRENALGREDGLSRDIKKRLNKLREAKGD
jgi:hypothetical protein